MDDDYEESGLRRKERAEYRNRWCDHSGPDCQCPEEPDDDDFDDDDDDGKEYGEPVGSTTKGI